MNLVDWSGPFTAPPPGVITMGGTMVRVFVAPDMPDTNTLWVIPSNIKRPDTWTEMGRPAAVSPAGPG